MSKPESSNVYAKIGFIMACIGTVLAPAALPAAPTLAGEPHVLWYEAPASQWIEALPVGNGRLGAMVFGGTTNERLQLNDITVWSGGPQLNANRPEGWKQLDHIRQVIREGRYKEAEKLCNQFLTCQVNYDDNEYQTLGDLNLAFALPPGEVTDYRRWLDLDTATAGVEFKAGGTTYRREVFSSAPDKVLVQRLSSSGPAKLSFELGSVTGLRARGGFEVSLKWMAGKLETARTVGVAGTHARLRYGGRTIELTLKPGEARLFGPALRKR